MEASDFLDGRLSFIFSITERNPESLSRPIWIAIYFDVDGGGSVTDAS